MGIPQEAIIAQARNELAKTQARLNVCKQVHNDLVAAKTLFEKAGTVGPLDAVKMIAEGLSLFIKTQARLNVCKQVHNDLVAAKTLFEKAGTVGPLDAVKMIAEGLSLFIKTQAGQLEMNIREMEGQAASLTESLKAADSTILRPTHMPPANSGGRQ